jgi:hypothetical protein
VRVRADVARKGQRKAADARRATVPHGGQPATGECCAAYDQHRQRATLPKIAAQPGARRVLRALETVKKVLTRRLMSHVLSRLMLDTLASLDA